VGAEGEIESLDISAQRLRRRCDGSFATASTLFEHTPDTFGCVRTLNQELWHLAASSTNGWTALALFN
jgi:hypothetical protein